MPRRVFFSFHFANDYWRTQQVRQINALEGQKLATPNAWETVKRAGDASIRRWIDANMDGKSCVVVLVGAQSAERSWVRYEIQKAWNEGRGLLGIRIHKLLDVNGRPSNAGANPFERLTFQGSTRSLADIAPLKSPAGRDSRATYASIALNIEAWIEQAIRIRKAA